MIVENAGMHIIVKKAQYCFFLHYPVVNLNGYLQLQAHLLIAVKWAGALSHNNCRSHRAGRLEAVT